MSSRCSRRFRQLLTTCHVISSVGWMGAGASNVVLAAIALNADDAGLRSACYLLIERLDSYLVIPLAFTALASGVIAGFCSASGVTRYWWVLLKLVLTVAVIGFSTFVIGVWVQTTVALSRAQRVDSTLAAELVVATSANLVAFAFLTWLSVAKPWGRTPWGRRRVRRSGGTPGA